MNWTDTAIVLNAQPFGEGAAHVQIFARTHGRIAGIVHGRRKNASTLQPGTVVEATWRARLEDQLGTLSLEPRRALPAGTLTEGGALSGLQSCLALVLSALPERDPHPAVFDGLALVIETLGASEVWPALIVRWEVGLLADLGFGLDLSTCALTGSREDLAYVSPRTGRAASRNAGAPYADRLLALPAFLVEGQGMRQPGWREIAQGLALTGHFLDTRLFAVHNKALPEARTRLAERAARLAAGAQAS